MRNAWMFCSVTLALSFAAMACGGGGDSGDSAGTGASSSSGPGWVDPGESVITRNKRPSRDGLYVQPTLTRAAAANMHLDATFKGALVGNVYAQPLYVENGPGGKGVFLVVTESNGVHALAEADGSPVWSKTLGSPAGKTGAGCGNISPLGITGTPSVDLPSRTIFVNAVKGDASTILRHEIHALSLDDGAEKAGYPFDVAAVADKASGRSFDPVTQNERGASLILGNTLYVPYGGHFGDCGEFYGWVIGVPLAKPASAVGWATEAKGGGAWAPGGVASDGSHVYVATGNTFGASAWGGGEAVIRLQAGPLFSGKTADYFTPSNWQDLDSGDIDIGGSSPLLIDVPDAAPSALAVALGKNGIAYLIDRNNLGGVGKGNGTTGEALASAKVASGQIINVAASYRTAKGVYVVFHISGGGSGIGCPAGQTGDLVALLVAAKSPPTFSVAWCAKNQGEGSPIATTTDGTNEVVVWTVGAEGSMKLHGFDGETGAVIFDGGAATDTIPTKVRRFTSPIAVKGRILTAGDNGLYAFQSP